MGAKLAQEIAESPLTLEEKLSWHLRGNLYPPMPDSMIPVCMEAINLAENGEDLHKILTMPENIKRAGSSEITAKQLIISTKLHWYIKNISLEFVEDYN
jgi:hypothetical protein